MNHEDYLSTKIHFAVAMATWLVPETCKADNPYHEWVNGYETLWDTGGLSPGYSDLPVTTKYEDGYGRMASFADKRNGPVKQLPFQVCRHCKARKEDK